MLTDEEFARDLYYATFKDTEFDTTKHYNQIILAWKKLPVSSKTTLELKYRFHLSYNEIKTKYTNGNNPKYSIEKGLKRLECTAFTPYLELNLPPGLYTHLYEMKVLELESILKLNCEELINNNNFEIRKIKILINKMEQAGFTKWAKLKREELSNLYSIDQDIDIITNYLFANRLYRAIFKTEDGSSVNMNGLNEALSYLSESEYTYINYRYNRNMSVVDISSIMGLSFDSLRNIEYSAFRKLSEPDIVVMICTKRLDERLKNLSEELISFRRDRQIKYIN